MTLSAGSLKLATIAAFLALAGAGMAVSAPSPDQELTRISDADFTNGADGVDYALVTGPQPTASAQRIPACADPVRRGDLRPC